MWQESAQNWKFSDKNLPKDFMDKRSLKSTELCSWRFCVFWNKIYLLKSQYWAVSLALLSKQTEGRDVWASNLSRSKFGETNQARGLPASRLTIDKRLCRSANIWNLMPRTLSTILPDPNTVCWGWCQAITKITKSPTNIPDIKLLRRISGWT